ncbi:hypothetical protein JOE40_002193 [Arthrobacter sp. PvP102]|uniref:hypothetical protein n=1 Tax=unclassified Arthrobacter TaxID=235627 RepID=UPI001AE35B3A|nr:MULTISPECIES: hypothetical protein [unclassified Arthrobacter]MBP1232549.1 hypothetical protein [Arthrobacter sp. PvP103]MBP1237684.1 hypothetical protein [Arthrobacter sp. PvP102]
MTRSHSPAESSGLWYPPQIRGAVFVEPGEAGSAVVWVGDGESVVGGAGAPGARPTAGAQPARETAAARAAQRIDGPGMFYSL